MSQTTQKKIRKIIFGTETPMGKLFDIILIIFIFLSVLVVMIDSVKIFHDKYKNILHSLEIIFTIMFTIEYFLRIYCIRRKFSYIFSFYGIIDLLSVIPTYLSFLLPGTEVFSVIRVLRVLRVFRVLKLAQYIIESEYLIKSMVGSKRKIFVFLFMVMNIVIIIGSSMYIIEGEISGFTSIPRSIYWAIVTLTTVGYGDISPITNLGQSIAAFIMIMGYSIIAVPGGIIIHQLDQVMTPSNELDLKNCDICEKKDINLTDKFCSNCGTELN